MRMERRTDGQSVRRAVFTAMAAVAVMATRLPAQDTVNVIDPNAPPAQTLYRGGPPEEVVREAIGRHNDSTATRFYGSFTVASATWIRGDVGMYRGTLKVLGRITGRVTIVNGGLVIGPNGAIDGEILLIGGKVQTLPGGQQTGGVQTYADLAPVYRNSAGLLEIREKPPSLGDLASASRSFTAGKLKTTLSLETGRTYNRVEGLPILVGPTFTLPTPDQGEAQLDLRAIFRTESDPTDQRDEVGFLGRFEWEHKGDRVRGGIGGSWSQVIDPIEDGPLSRSEVGWATFLVARDYRDYFENMSVGGYGFYYPIRSLRLEASVRYRRETTVPASDPLTVFSDPDNWRPNPLIDDGHYSVLAGQVEFDTRNSVNTPTSGWLAKASFEHGVSGDVAPAALPVEVREPLPSSGSYGFSKVWFDLRRYARINTLARANLRVVGGGWIAGDPLPVQRRVSLGGPDLLPGYEFRSQTCAPAGYSDAAQTALCDRTLAVQAEVRFRFHLGLREQLGAQDLVLLERLVGAEQADVVLFGDMGKGWLSGDGPGRVPNNKLPALREWQYDVGLGLDLDGIAVYVATPVGAPWAPRITFRLQRRF